MNEGKFELKEIKKIISENSDSMVKTNVIGSDFSHVATKGREFIFKIEPMIYYDFLAPTENAYLSFTFPMNDFLCSGRGPSYAMIDFESPSKSGKDYLSFIRELYKLLRKYDISLVSAHTGRYSNSNYGVLGSLALIGTERPIFCPGRIKGNDTFFAVGKLGIELLFFSNSMKRMKNRINKKRVSVEGFVDAMKENRKTVHFIHDLSEGGLVRGLEELEVLTGRGFDIQTTGFTDLVPEGLRYFGDKIYFASSSGSLVVAVDSSRESSFRMNMEKAGIPVAKLERRSKGIRIDGKKLYWKDDIQDMLNK